MKNGEERGSPSAIVHDLIGIDNMSLIKCQAKVEMSCSYQDRNVLFFRFEILRIFLCHNGGS